MQELDMEVKHNFNPYYCNEFVHQPKRQNISFYGGLTAHGLDKSADIFVRGAIADKNAVAPRSFVNKLKDLAKNYVKNIKHTYDHKIIFAMIEKELFGKNSIDAITHDADKLIMYSLGFPKSFVSNWHRKHSVHHTESGKQANLRSMLCDNIASSPEFKPEKKLSLREHFKNSSELQKVKGFKEILEKYNFGENLDFNKIKRTKELKYHGFISMATIALKALLLLFKTTI